MLLTEMYFGPHHLCQSDDGCLTWLLKRGNQITKQRQILLLLDLNNKNKSKEHIYLVCLYCKINMNFKKKLKKKNFLNKIVCRFFSDPIIHVSLGKQYSQLNSVAVAAHALIHCASVTVCCRDIVIGLPQRVCGCHE